MASPEHLRDVFQKYPDILHSSWVAQTVRTHYPLEDHSELDVLLLLHRCNDLLTLDAQSSLRFDLAELQRLHHVISKIFLFSDVLFRILERRETLNLQPIPPRPSTLFHLPLSRSTRSEQPATVTYYLQYPLQPRSPSTRSRLPTTRIAAPNDDTNDYVRPHRLCSRQFEHPYSNARTAQYHIWPYRQDRPDQVQDAVCPHRWLHLNPSIDFRLINYPEAPDLMDVHRWLQDPSLLLPH